MKAELKGLWLAPAGLVALGLLLFWPAGTLNYWQAWVFIVVFTLATVLPSVYLAYADPAALRRRTRGGPWAETRTVQKFAITGSILGLFAMLALSALDHRFGWSRVPASVAVAGDALVVIGLAVGMLVITQNSYASSGIQVESGQKLASEGLYRLVRHPMYAGSLLTMLGIPLALGSYWGLLVVIPGVLMLVLRILDEEKLLVNELGGYREYTQRVRYRLLPYVW
jgi:protein-S-isoprenylcysteine O-methyltransferase Ste14